MKTEDLVIQCRCGAMAITARNVSIDAACRLACHCGGCRGFAERFAPELIDELGGVERIQVSPATLSFASGREHLQCLRQTPKGALRWNAGCCDTPMLLTLENPAVPFVGIDALRVVPPPSASLDEVVGPVRVRVNTAFKGDEARIHRANARALLGMLAHLAPLTFRWWWRGDHRASPFFTAGGEPVEQVQRLFAPGQLASDSSSGSSSTLPP